MVYKCGTLAPELNCILLFLLSFTGVPSNMMVFETAGPTGLHSPTPAHHMILLENYYIHKNRTLFTLCVLNASTIGISSLPVTC
jgi:hypothetical protein